MNDHQKMEEDELRLQKLREENEKKDKKKKSKKDDDDIDDLEDENEDDSNDESNQEDGENEEGTDNESNEPGDENSDDVNIESEKQDNESTRKDIEECFLIGYDSEYNAYILLRPISKNLPMGGAFFPFWNLSIDENGKVIIPVFNRFMNKSSLEFEIKMEDKSKIVKIKTIKIKKNNLLSSRVKFE